MTTAVATAPAVRPEVTTYRNAIVAYVKGGERPTFKGQGFTKDEKDDLLKFQRETIKALPDAEKKAFHERQKKEAAAKREERGPAKIRIDVTWLKELDEILTAVIDATKSRKATVLVGGKEIKGAEAIAIAQKSVADLVANPPKPGKQATPEETVPHTVIRFAKAGGEPFVYGKYDDKKAADHSAKLFVKRLEAVGPGVADGFEFKVLPVDEAVKQGYAVPEQKAA